MRPSPVWDIFASRLHRPLDAEAVPKCGERWLAEVVASQFEGAFATNVGLGVIRKRGEAVNLVKNAYEDVRRLEALKAAEAPWLVGQDRLVVLVEAADDQFRGVALPCGQRGLVLGMSCFSMPLTNLGQPSGR